MYAKVMADSSLPEKGTKPAGNHENYTKKAKNGFLCNLQNQYLQNYEYITSENSSA